MFSVVLFLLGNFQCARMKPNLFALVWPDKFHSSFWILTLHVVLHNNKKVHASPDPQTNNGWPLIWCLHETWRAEERQKCACRPNCMPEWVESWRYLFQALPHMGNKGLHLIHCDSWVEASRQKRPLTAPWDMIEEEGKKLTPWTCLCGSHVVL